MPAEIRTGTLATLTEFAYLANLGIIIIISEVRLSPLGTAATAGLLYKRQMIDDGDYEAIGGMKLAGEPEVLGECCLSATLSTTNPT
jgi:hypothetical protein